jgi:PilZ domain
MVVLTLSAPIGDSVDSVNIQKAEPPEEDMAEAVQEKRAARRFALQIPVTVNRGEGSPGEPAQIRDVSARGICLYLDTTVEQGSPIGFTLTLPPEITLTESIRVQCKGHVVRVENGLPDGKLAVAAVIEDYEFLPES